MNVFADFKYAMRILAKKPAFTSLTTLVMATGIGLSIYLFSFMHTMIFKPLPFKDGDTLVEISGSKNGLKSNAAINLHDYEEIRNTVSGLTEFGAYAVRDVNVMGRDGARRYKAVTAESSLFAITRTQPVMGRAFTANEDRPGAERVVVISHDIWQNLYGGDPEVVDQTLRIDRTPYRVLGVMPEGYGFPTSAEIWMPLAETATSLPRDEASHVYGIAHLEPGASKETVTRELAVIMQRIAERYPETNAGLSAYVDTLQMAMVGDSIAVVYAMYIVALLILLLASINTGSLLLARAIERSKETAIRAALGAPRFRLIAQMLWESVIICTLGGVVGLLLLAWGLEITETVTASFFVGKPMFWMRFGVDGFTLTVFFVVLLCTILLTGLLPAWRNSSGDINAVLRDGTRGAQSKKTGRLNRFLVISEIFISVFVLIVATNTVVIAYRASYADYGANTDKVLVAQLSLEQAKYSSHESQIQFIETLKSQLQTNPAVENVAISSALPGEFSVQPAMAIEGKVYANDDSDSYPRENYIAVTQDSLQNLGIELLAGRYFTSSDEGTDKQTVIITESFAKRHFGEDAPIGKRLRITEYDGDTPQWLTVVGVVEHTVQGTPHQFSGLVASVFRPFSQDPRSSVSIAVKVKTDFTAATALLRESIASIDSDLPASKIESYERSLARNTDPLRFTSKVFLLFGIAATILAASGIYGMMSNTIQQRTQEIGVKRALGAVEERITREFLFQGIGKFLWGAIPGLLLGGAMGFAMSEDMGKGQGDLVFVVITLTSLIGFVVIVATYLPTQLALKMRPSEALRYE